MARYILSSRRSNRSGDNEREDLRKVLASAIISLPAEIVQNEISQVSGLPKRVLIDTDAENIALIKEAAKGRIIVEPEILHYVAVGVPAEFLKNRSTWEKASVPAGSESVTVQVTGDGAPLSDAEVALFLRGPGGLQRRLVAHSNSSGDVTFSFHSSYKSAAVVVRPESGYWSMISRDQRSSFTVNCESLPKSGPTGWWHELTRSASVADLGRRIRIGVIDTGVGPHPHLQHVHNLGSVIDGVYDMAGGADNSMHGTHVSGTIAARTDQPSQFGGIAPGVELYSVRVFPPGRGASQLDIATAIDLLSGTHKVDLINLSLSAEKPSEIEHGAILDAEARGTLCVCAAANVGGAVHYPAAFPEAIAVSALGKLGWGPVGSVSANNVPQESDRFGDNNLHLANFSCFGPEIDVTAPGVGVIAPVPVRFNDAAPYAAMDGTSMASPVACGALAAILAGSPDYQSLPRDISRTNLARKLLTYSCVDIGLDSDLQGKGVPSI